MLIERAASRDVPVSVVTRESGWSAIVERTNPIFVTVLPDLPTVMARIPATRIPDVILCQNGMLTPWLHEQNWSQVTRGVYTWQYQSEERPYNWQTRVHSLVLKQKLLSTGFLRWTFLLRKRHRIDSSKSRWKNCSGTASLDFCVTSVKSRWERYVSEASAIASMTEELLHVTLCWSGVHLDVDAVLRGMLDYSATIPDYVGRVSDWEFRNGWFVRAASSLGSQCPRMSGGHLSFRRCYNSESECRQIRG